MERKSNLTRQQLYDLVWAHPVSELAKVYGLSDRGFARLCDRNSVPTPPRGYWAKSPSARRGLKPPLLLQSGSGQDITMPSSAAQKAAMSSNGAEGENRYRQLYEELRTSLPALPVAKTLVKPHPEIKKILDQDARWVASMRGSIWSTARSDYGTPLERRKLRVRSALLFAMEVRGFAIRNSGRTPADIEIMVGHTPLKLKIWEHVRQFRRQLTEEERAEPHNVHATFKQGREATGLLRVQIAGHFSSKFPTTWHESEDEPLEMTLHEVLAGLIVAATYLQEKREAEMQRERETREREDAHYAKLETSRQEAERRRALHDRALCWRDAVLIREYVAAVKAAAPELEEAQSKIEAWATWALATADRLDPLTGGGAIALTPLRPPVPQYARWDHREPPDTASQDARLRRIYGYPFVPY